MKNLVVKNYIQSFLNSFFFIAICVSALSMQAQNTIRIQKNIKWQTPQTIDNQIVQSFEDAAYDLDHPTLPVWIERFELPTYGELSVEIKGITYEPLTKAAHADDAFLNAAIQIDTDVMIARRAALGEVSCIPIRKTATGYEKVTSIELEISVRPQPMPLGKNKRSGDNSVLADGDIYKIAVSTTGVYRLSYDFLKNTVGMDIDNIDPRNIQLYGNGGGMLPESNATDRTEDLEENAIIVVGESDGSFDAQDYILFYGESPHAWMYNSGTELFSQEIHHYDDNNHYFIKVSTQNGKRVATQASVVGATYSTNSFSEHLHYEQDLVNLLNDFVYSSASGREWYGESFKFTTNRDFNFEIPDIEPTAPIYTTVRVAGRAVNVTSTFNVYGNGVDLMTLTVPSVNGGVETYYARTTGTTGFFNSSSSNINIRMQFNKPTSDADGWLNFITLNTRRRLNFTGGQMTFRDIETIGQAISDFSISTAVANANIWNVTDPTNAFIQSYNNNGNSLQFGANTTDLQEFIIFDNDNFLEPTFVGAVTNQNLHGSLAAPDAVIVYHEKFKDAAERLAAHRSSFSNMRVSTAELTQIYNEFSSGNADVTAIRDFAKYLYEEFPNFNYLVLFGDGSFDYKNIRQNENNHNYIPVYETSESEHTIRSYASDDYFTLLDPNEGNINSGAMDIAVGRITVREVTEADDVVNKIIYYDNNPAVLGDWKNRLTFLGDDEDGDLHLRDADEIAEATSLENPVYNLDKIYFDAFPQISTHGGERFPAVTDALNANMFKGQFVINYMGHGGEKGWAQERVLQIPHIQSWSNQNKLPLFVTATCSFAPYDDPALNSAGEMILLKPDGGAIALFTTVRAVYTSSNKKLTRAVFDNLFKPVNGVVPPMGEILRYAKNTSGAGTENSRKFALLGDPAQCLSYPKYKVITTTINGQPAISADTIRAFQRVTVRGFIADADSNMVNDFNGEIYPTVFDKKATYTTLGQDATSSPRDYQLQKIVLFKGRASVTNGQFEFTFIVPKDINYTFGNGKISYYADNGSNLDAGGVYSGIVIGGTDSTALADNQGPNVQVFMNNEDFVFGGITDANPTLFVKLEDDNGINTSGTGIGHDLTGVLNENTQNTYVLNDFYEAELDNYKRGTVSYPLSDLEDGRHQIRVKAWDIANNSGEGFTEFVVASSANIALDHVLNYPNPFTTRTEFQFEHNLPNQPLTVQVQIFTVSGRLVKTILQDVQPTGYRVTGIEWDGTDDFGSRIGRGVYVYKVSVHAVDGGGNVASESQFEKLVILK